MPSFQKHLSLSDLGALLVLLACYGYCITIQTRYRVSIALAARDAADAIERVDAPTAAVTDTPLGRAA